MTVDKETMIERVAQAMLESKAWPVVFQAGSARVLARAAIEAMREPTTEMKRGLIRHRGYDPDAKEETLDKLGQLDLATMGTHISSYQAMIDAALDEDMS